MFSHWHRVLFINLEVERAALQREVPFALDLYEGRAFISLVTFTVCGMRPRFGGRVATAMFAPLQIGELFNVRTYVRCQGEPAIYFLAEWLGSRLNLHLGPLAYGLPYRLGCLRYRNRHEDGKATGEICDSRTGGHVAYHAEFSGRFAPAQPGSLDEFIVERYTCFTDFRGPRRFFRIWHPEWPQVRAEVRHFENDLLVANWPWLRDARIVGANYSPGLDDVWLGRPHMVKSRPRSAFLRLP
jgi:uncharacterized protein YqjF (DUF2071 family)